jgi:hypothetical protein
MPMLDSLRTDARMAAALACAPIANPRKHRRINNPPQDAILPHNQRQTKS